MNTPTGELKAPVKMKFVIVTGGVVSGLGKGITASSIGLCMKQSGLRVTSIKIDPYLNIDAGTMSPYEHGEVFVLDDGGEADLDLGNYERFLSISLTSDHNITNGKVYQKVLNTERRGDYLGKTVQMVPHVTNCIQEWIERVAQIPCDGSDFCPDVCVIELGGTVGDLESVLFLEAIRQLKFRFGDNIFHVHVSLIPILGNVGEPKSKPTQHSVIALRTTGLVPNCIVLRCSKRIPQKIINKVSLFSMVPSQNIIGVHDVDNIYCVPQLLYEKKMMDIIVKCLNLDDSKKKIDLSEWNRIANHFTNKNMNFIEESKVITVGIVGKYTGLSDSYLSVTKALISAAYHSQLDIKIVWIESAHLESPTETEEKKDDTSSDSSSDGVPTVVVQKKDLTHNIDILESPKSDKNKNKKCVKTSDYRNAWNKVKSVDGILIPGGFGDRGIAGKILAVNYARTHNIPFFGICLGMQMAVIEYARNVCGRVNAHSSEFDETTTNPVVMFMPEIDSYNMGGTMRLGSRLCNLSDDSMAKYLYGSNKVYERHRHRYEVNPKYIDELSSAGLMFTGKDEQFKRMEIVELAPSVHPFFFGCQFHPEFKSGPLKPSPPFAGFVKACSGLLFKESQYQKQFARNQNIQKLGKHKRKLNVQKLNATTT